MSNEYSGMTAELPNGTKVEPTSIRTIGYHGTNLYSPEEVLSTGIPKKGDDYRLAVHQSGNPDSAFRGMTALAASLDSDSGNSGAVDWAGKDGWVYQIADIPAWDMNMLLAGRVPKVSIGYSDGIYEGESELAIPSNIKPIRIRRIGKVKTNRKGKLIPDFQYDQLIRGSLEMKIK